MKYPKVLYQFKDCAGEPFRPSNGTEGEIFAEAFCDRCVKGGGDRDCRFYNMTLWVRADDPLYPKEWVFNADGWPICTAFESGEEG